VEEWSTEWKPVLSKYKKVEQLDENDNVIAVFINQSEAARQIGASSPKTISRTCNGLNKTAYGYKWRFANEVI